VCKVEIKISLLTDELAVHESVELMTRGVHVQIVTPFTLVLKAALVLLSSENYS
jgi:hypothetical protein